MNPILFQPMIERPECAALGDFFQVNSPWSTLNLTSSSTLDFILRQYDEGEEDEEDEDVEPEEDDEEDSDEGYSE